MAWLEREAPKMELTVSIAGIERVVGKALALHTGDWLVVRLLGLLRLSIILAPDGVGCGVDNLVDSFHNVQMCVVCCSMWWDSLGTDIESGEEEVEIDEVREVWEAGWILGSR
jgi:hypothetical protein